MQSAQTTTETTQTYQRVVLRLRRRGIYTTTLEVNSIALLSGNEEAQEMYRSLWNVDGDFIKAVYEELNAE